MDLDRMIERETPKRLERFLDRHYWSEPIGDCPNCAKILSRGPRSDINNYCYHCGQKLDWGGLKPND
jgi:hypothetical protein